MAIPSISGKPGSFDYQKARANFKHPECPKGYQFKTNMMKEIAENLCAADDSLIMGKTAYDLQTNKPFEEPFQKWLVPIFKKV